MCNTTPVSQSARTHGLGWRTAHASSIDEKGLIYIFKATSAPPRAGTTGIYIYIYTPILIYKDIMNNDVECFYNLSHVVFFLIRPRFVEQLRQGSQELGSECAVASRQRLLLVLVLFICTQTCNTKHIPGIYISIV